ncbi:unnamed protein product [Chrysodeixis includens]|uniref:TIL domain-containing protein n=1 Tax=Chrysodeixis includens TaxID=689277 RepID=A0A9N8L0W4_CHRIL|nr:unnamed protein product [Chrysodeixis includens]
MIRLLIVLVSCYTVMCRQVHNNDTESANCRPDEEFKWIYPCPGEDTCKDRDQKFECPAEEQTAEAHCVCKEGLFRAEDGSCYTNKQCNKWKCPGDHEYYECGGVCDNVCDALHLENKTNCSIQDFFNPYNCFPKCYCEDGYARDDQGNCIPIEKCGGCRPDEVYKSINTCPGEDTCKNRDDGLVCFEDFPSVESKCVCKEGLYRAEDGSCYTNEQCNKWKCPGDHEHFECDTECDNVCATLDRQNKTNCPIRRFKYFNICSPKCYCDDGYARDDQGNCIPIEECGLFSTTEITEEVVTESDSDNEIQLEY